jgi:hypothetical protein
VKNFVVIQVKTGITTHILNDVAIYEWNRQTGYWIRTDTWHTPWINGWIELDPDYPDLIWSSFINGRLTSAYVPPPGGLGGHDLPIMPAKVK